LLFRQGLPPYASYVFKHALIQDVAYGMLLRDGRRALHARIAETLEVQFPEIAETQPELLARHCTDAGLIEKAAGLWSKAGQRSLGRSALVEAVAQLTRALDQIATLAATPALRREEIRLQVALITPLIHVKGYTAIETKNAIELARLAIEKAEALGEVPDDPLLLFSVLYGFWVSNFVAFDGHVCRDLATHFLALAEKHNATAQVLMAHRIMGQTLLFSGDIVRGRMHLDKGIALYDPGKHSSLAIRFGHDAEVVMLSCRSIALCVLGYPDAALRDAADALKKARAMNQAATLMFALYPHRSYRPPTWSLSSGYETGPRASRTFGRETRGLEPDRRTAPRQRTRAYRQGISRSPNEHLHHRRAALERGEIDDANVAVALGMGQCRPRSTR
jgi:hypothetical protein